MKKSSAEIIMPDATRIAKRLYNHWKHKFDVVESQESLSILMPQATILLTPQEQYLHVSIEMPHATVEEISHLQHVVLDHLNRMAQQEFTAEWQIYS